MTTLSWRIEHFDELPSTNTELVTRWREGEVAGAVLVTDFQLAGKGRRDREWMAPPKSSLLCSVLIEVHSSEAASFVPFSAALATKNALESLMNISVGMKWPNDLLVGEKKLAGILSEYLITGDRQAVVVGIGVNLTYAGPEQVRATSVSDEVGSAPAPQVLLEALLEELSHRLELLESEAGRKELRAEYEASLSTLGQVVNVTMGDRVVSGFAQGIDKTGQLIVATTEGEVHCNVGDVIHVRPVTEPSL
ncbi:MAG: biotin--[acetyl-CoA-carboxylase] ligase [Actinomycetota bacterium]